MTAGDRNLHSDWPWRRGNASQGRTPAPAGQPRQGPGRLAPSLCHPGPAPLPRSRLPASQAGGPTSRRTANAFESPSVIHASRRGPSAPRRPDSVTCPCPKRGLARATSARGWRRPGAADRNPGSQVSRSRRACFHRNPRPGSGVSMHTPLPPPRVREATRSRCVSYREWRSTSPKPRGLGPVLTRPRERTRPACLRRRLGPDAWAKRAAVRGEEQGEAVGSDPTRRAARGSRGFGRPAGVRAGTDRGIRSQGNTHHADGRPAGPGRA